jgi:parvulin-like peptidyl-prolyl isomerase
MNLTPNRLAPGAVLALALLTSGAAPAAAPPAPAATPAAAVFARIGDSVITQQEFDARYVAAVRAKYYHGKPPDADLAVLRREVGEQMVERALLLREADRRKMRPDDAAVQHKIKAYEQRYAASAQWKQNRATALPPLVAKLEQESVLAQLETSARNGAAPSAAAVSAYYAANPAKFTEPEQMRVAVILLKVDPSAPKEDWIKVDAKAEALAARARKGEDFAALARKYSADPSAAKGGDMGYLHTGMLPDGTQQALAKMAPGATSDSLRLLEGLAVFRLVDRKPAKLLGFDAVKTRAQELAQRDQADQRWNTFLAELKLKTPVRIEHSGALALPAQAKPGAIVK